jgi:hypothetical protein
MSAFFLYRVLLPLSKKNTYQKIAKTVFLEDDRFALKRLPDDFEPGSRSPGGASQTFAGGKRFLHPGFPRGRGERVH